MKYFSVIICVLFLFTSCDNEVIPKPKCQLRLSYSIAEYNKSNTNYPLVFDLNKEATLLNKDNGAIEVVYPKMKATIYITYKNVTNDLDDLLTDAQKLTYKLHVIKANEITEQPFLNQNDKTYGMFYQVGGDAAANALFYATDSTHHFVTASVYFYAKPNYDSILPAADYISNDMRKMLETLQWKN